MEDVPSQSSHYSKEEQKQILEKYLEGGNNVVALSLESLNAALLRQLNDRVFSQQPSNDFQKDKQK